MSRGGPALAAPARPPRRLAPAALVVLLIASPPAIAGPAPEAGEPVRAMGLFPLDDLRGSLSLLSEHVEVTPRADGCEVRRQYRVRCKGSAGSYRLVTALIGPDRRASGIDTTVAISVDGEPQDLLLYDGLLLNGGSSVRVLDPGEEAIRSCWERGERDVCGHTWAELTLPIRRNEIRTVDLYYRYPTAGVDSALAFAIDHATIYTESFWANSPIPRIELRMDARGLPVPLARWTFAGELGRESIVDYRNEGGVLVARIRNLRAWKEPRAPERLMFPPR